jgi:hypothetical protein
VEFAADKPRGASSALPENAFLMNFDLSYRLRRLRFVIDRIETFMRAVEPLDAVPFDENHDRVVPRRHQHADAILESTEHRGQAWSEVADADRDAARAWLRKLRGSLAGAQSVLRAAGRRLRKPGAGNPLAAEVERLGFEWDDLKRVLNASDDEGRIMAGRAVLGIPLEGGLSGEPSAKLKGVRALAKVIADELRKEFDRASSKVTMAFAPTELPEGSSVLTDQLRRCLWHHYRRFDYFDMVLFPMVAGTDVGELHEVDVLRISPEDAGSLIDERDPETHRRLRSKLAGTRLGNFGAFLDSIWRRSDILWGRLDGAERLIRGLYPLPHDGQPGREAHEACVDSMVRRAHGAIVSEELSGLAPETARRVFVEALLHSQTGDPEPKLLEHVLERLEGVIPDATVRVALKPADVQSTYDFAYRRLRELDRTKQLRLIARATTTFGKMLDGLSDRYAVLKDKRPVWWILTVGRMLWGMIEISAPRSLLELVARYWMNVLFALELLMLAGGILFHSAPVRDVALALLVVTAALDLCRRLLGAYLHYGGVRKFVAVMVALVLGLAIYGGKTLWPSVQEAVNTLVSQPNGVAIALAGLAAATVMGSLLRYLLDRLEARELKKFDREDARAAIT